MFSIVYTRCSVNGEVIVFTVMIIGSVYVKRHLKATLWSSQINLLTLLVLVPFFVSSVIPRSCGGPGHIKTEFELCVGTSVTGSTEAQLEPFPSGGIFMDSRKIEGLLWRNKRQYNEEEKEMRISPVFILLPSFLFYHPCKVTHLSKYFN